MLGQPKQNTATLPHKNGLRMDATLVLPSYPSLSTMVECKRFEQFYAAPDAVLHGGLCLLGIPGRCEPDML